jgi:hypothetical protein
MKEEIKGIVTIIGEKITAKSGSTYCRITLDKGQQGILFFKFDVPIQLNQEVTLTATKKEDGSYLFNLPTARTGGGFRAPQINKDLEALKLAIQLVCAGKIELAQLENWIIYLKQKM